MNQKSMTHRDLTVWKVSIEFVTTIYKVTKDFPSDERYGLVTQMRRASVSVASNIAEGAARSSTKELINFLFIASGSLSELETQILISFNLKYIDSIVDLNLKIKYLRKMLNSLINSLKSKLNA